MASSVSNVIRSKLLAPSGPPGRLWDDGRMTIPAEVDATRRTAVALRDALPWPQLAQLAEAAEETGYEAVFVPEIAGREAFSTLTGLAAATSGLRLGTGVVSMWSRSPATLAMAAATVHELSGGRLILGIGAGAGSAPGPVATALRGRAGPVHLLRSYVQAVKRILSGDQAPAARDDLFPTEGFTLGVALPQGPPPVWLAALGDRMVALGGEIAEGVLLNWCTPERVEKARRSVTDVAERSGRDP